VGPGLLGTFAAVVAVVGSLAPPVGAQQEAVHPEPGAGSTGGVIPVLGLDVYLPVPEDNPLRPEVVKLGRSLFFDPVLSADSTFACATCHRPEQGFTNRRPTSVGVHGRRGKRNVPAIFNRGYGRAFFWDGRIATLEEQVLQPIIAEDEMAMILPEATQRLARDPEYARRFNRAFSRPVNADDLARALASYVRTIRAGGSPFDRFVAGDATALSDLEREGLEIFQGKGRCVRCHTGTNLTDERFHNTGVAWRDGVLHDEGRALVTGAERDRGAFKTPTLREVPRTPPYMHDGSLATLEDVVDFYNDGGRANPYLDPRIAPLDLSDQERRALVAFLTALKGEIREGM
jgi:cytochrome c peroxidase